MSKYIVYVNSECIWDGYDYNVALQVCINCITDDPYCIIELYKIYSYGNVICMATGEFSR